ncbi:MAG: hypothetical protein ABI442_07125, partial [Gemmatimonadaceae bacterium]
PVSEYRRRIFDHFMGRVSEPGEADHALRVWHGEGAVEHLFLVAAGLDSTRVGETEVVAQVREALELSHSLGLTGSHLAGVFAESLKVAKRVRPVTEGKEGAVSLSDIAMRYVLERLARTPGKVVLVGVSPMTERGARSLTDRGVPIVIVNRTLVKAVALAAELGAHARQLDEYRESPDDAEVMITATGGGDPIFSRADLERIAMRAPSGEPPLIVDLGVPPNVLAEDATAADLKRIGMDDINRVALLDRDRRLTEVAEARAIVDEALTDLRRSTAERLIGPMIAQLRLRYRHTAMTGVERLFERDLAGVGEPEREVIRRWAETLANRFAHVPSLGLRDLVYHVGPSAVEAFFGTAEPELARAMHDAAEHAGLEPGVDMASD